MTNIRIKLDKRAKRADNSYPVVLTLHHRATIRISTRISAQEEEWSDMSLFRGNNTTVRAKNARLRYLLSQAETLLLNLSMSGELTHLTDKELRARIERALDIARGVGGGVTLVDYLERAKTGKSPRTANLFYYTQCHVKEFSGDKRIDDIDERWVTEYRDYYASRFAAHSLRSDLARLSRAFNIAIDDGVVTRNPVRAVKKPKGRVRKKALSIEALRALRDLKISNPGKRRARDIFMLQLYLIGINLADLYSAVSLSNGRLEYARHKTGTLYSIKVEPEAMRLIESMKGCGKLVDIPYKSPISAVSSITGSLQRLGIAPGLSTNWARHTWATIAAELEIPIETISHALGHQIGSPVTAIYVAFNQKKVDDANRRVIDYINADLCDCEK